MISRDAALGFFLAGPGSENPEDFAYKILTGEESPYIGSPWIEFPPEDILAQVLGNDSTPADIERAVIKACEQVGAEALAYLAVSTTDTADHPAALALERLCRVIEIAHPEELRLLVTSLFPLAKRRANDWPNVMHDVISAFAAYEQTEVEAPYWEGLVKNRALAAFAFNKLLDIDPNHSRIRNNLKELWLKHLQEGWEVNASFLAQRVLEKGGVLGLISVWHVLRSIKLVNKGLYDNIIDNLRNRVVDHGELWLSQLYDLASKLEQVGCEVPEHFADKMALKYHTTNDITDDTDEIIPPSPYAVISKDQYENFSRLVKKLGYLLNLLEAQVLRDYSVGQKLQRDYFSSKQKAGQSSLVELMLSSPYE